MSKPISYCCNMLDQAVNQWGNVYYNAVFDEYALPLPGDSHSVQLLQYCPWCGRRMPNSKRESWFAQLEKLGFDNPLLRKDLPEDYTCAAWWQDGIK